MIAGSALIAFVLDFCMWFFLTAITHDQVGSLIIVGATNVGLLLIITGVGLIVEGSERR